MKASELIAQLAKQAAGGDDPEVMLSIKIDDAIADDEGSYAVFEIVEVESSGGWHVWLRNFKSDR